MALTATSEDRHKLRFFLLNLETLQSSEANPSIDAKAQMYVENQPALRAAEWGDGPRVRFPAGSVNSASAVDSDHRTTGQRVEFEASSVSHTPWYEASFEEDNTLNLGLLDTPAIRALNLELPHEVDPRIRVRILSDTAFDLLDHEHSRTITRITAPFMIIDLATARVSPDGAWVAITVYQENFGSKGERAFLIDRQSGQRFFIADDVPLPLQFHPTEQVIFGVSRDPRHRGRLMRWKY